MQGFLIFRNSHLRYEKAIWLLLMTLAIAVTLNDTCKTVRDFMKDEILSKVSMIRSDTITLPELYIIAETEFTNSSAVRSLMSKNGSEVFDFLTVHEKTILTYYEVVDEKKIVKTDILLPVLRLAVQLLMEFQESYTFNDKNRSANVGNFSPNGIDVEALSNSPVRHLHNFFKRNGIHLADVSRATGMYLCKLTSLEVELNETANSVCHRPNIIGLDNTTVIIRLRHVFNFTDAADVVNIRARPMHPDIQVSRLIGRFGLKTVDFKENAFIASNSEQSYFDVEVTSVKLYSSRESPCSDCQSCQSHVLCSQLCKARILQSRCGCLMLQQFLLFDNDTCARGDICFDWLSFNESGSNRSTTLLRNCMIELSSDLEIWITCDLQCPKSCFYLHLRMSRSSLYGTSQNSKDNSTKISFGVSSHTHMYVEQVPAMDAQTFMSNLGGNLGLYIGGTILAIIHLMTSLTRLVVSLVVAKNNDDSNADDSNELQPTTTTSAADATKAEMMSMKETIASLLADVRLLKNGSLEQ